MMPSHTRGVDALDNPTPASHTPFTSWPVSYTHLKVDAFLSVTADTARAKAKEVDEKSARGETLGVLAGIPVGIKDNICTKRCV